MITGRTASRGARTSVGRSRLAAGVIVLTCGLFSAAGADGGLFGLGMFGPSGDTTGQQQTTIQNESAAMLRELYAAKPEMRGKIASAAGYATFKKTDLKLLLVSSGSGYGVLVNNQTGQQTYMRVASLGGGVGMGVNDLRVIFVFNDPAVMQQFVTQGWQFGGDADASAQYQNVGAAAGQSAQANVNFNDGTVAGASSTNVGSGSGSGQNVSVGNGMEIYQFTESGISLQATVSGTKYWVDSNLNN